MPDPTPSDESLMLAAKAGSIDAFRQLYDRHHRIVFQFLLRSLGDRRAAEDLLQETFFRVFVNREHYRATAAWRSWLFTIARNLVIDHVRQEGKWTGLESDEPLEAVPDPAGTPLQHAEARELGERLQAGVLRLPPPQREVLLLSRFGGLSANEIGQITGASPEAVRVTLHRALRRLRGYLGPL